MVRRDFGRYKIAEEIGRGAMGVVYRALDPAVGRSVAIKAINTGYLEGVGVRASEYLERFRREAEVAGSLSHPGIVKIFDLGPDFLVMEFVAGQSLATLLLGKVRLPPQRILRVVAEVAEALDYAHAHGVVHRDIKPANVMVQPDGSAKVMDFGLARIESSTLTAAGEILGSASYMAPEVVLGRPADARSDIFSLGVVSYEMMTGHRPFGGSSITVIIQNIVRTSPRPARQLNSYLPPAYDDIFAKVLAKEPDARYAAAADFASELNLRTWAEPESVATDVTVVGVPMLHAGDFEAPTLPKTPRPDLDRPGVDAGARTVLMQPGETPLAPAPPSGTAKTVVNLAATMPAAAPAPPSSAPPDRPAPPTAVLPAASPGEPAPPPAPSAPAGGISPRLLAALAAAAVVALLAVGAVGLWAYRVLIAGQGPPPTEAPATTLIATPPETAAPETTPATTLEAVETPAETPVPAEPAPPKPVAPALAPLTITSEPSGGRVTIAQRNRGTTPLTLKFAPGTLAVTIEKDGYRPFRRDVAVGAAGATLAARLEPLAAEPTPGKAAPAAVQAGDLVALGPDVTPPRRVSGDPPKLPDAAKSLKQSSSVLVEFVVDETGGVRDAKVLESAGAQIDAACLDAVRAWRYEPASTQGVKVKVAQRARFSFQSR